jgi:chromosome transmission fidelity protein 8
MQIRVKCNCNEENCEEWGIVELQGVVESQPGFQDSPANLQIGILCRRSSQVTYLHYFVPSLIINYTN